MKKETIKKYFTYGIIIILILLLFFIPRGIKDIISGKNEITTTVRTDTVWGEVHDTINKEVKVVSYKYVKIPGEQYTSGDNLDTCAKRLDKLVKAYGIQTIYLDTIKLDTLGIKGTLTVRDLIWKNKFEGKRQYISNLKVPTIEKTTTITKTADPVRQFYFGGNLYGDKERIQLVTPGILYKDKKDRIYQANLGVNFDGQITYGLGAYYKISFKKKK